MKRNAVLGLLFALFIMSCPDSTGDVPETLKMVLLDYYDCIKNGDHEKITSVTAPDFLIYEVRYIPSRFTTLIKIN